MLQSLEPTGGRGIKAPLRPLDFWFASMFLRFCAINRNAKGNPKARKWLARILKEPTRSPPSVAGVLYSDKRTKISAETGALWRFY